MAASYLEIADSHPEIAASYPETSCLAQDMATSKASKVSDILKTLSSSSNKPASSWEYRIVMCRQLSVEENLQLQDHSSSTIFFFFLVLITYSILFSHYNKFSHLLKRKYKNILGLISMFNRHKSILPSVSIDKDIDNPVLDKPS